MDLFSYFLIDSESTTLVLIKNFVVVFIKKICTLLTIRDSTLLLVFMPQYLIPCKYDRPTIDAHIRRLTL